MVIANSAMLALEQVQKAFEGEAERLDLKSERRRCESCEGSTKKNGLRKRRKRSNENHAGHQCFDLFHYFQK